MNRTVLQIWEGHYYDHPAWEIPSGDMLSCTSRLTSILRKGHPFEPQDIQPSKKMDIPFLLNNIWLGSFGTEETFTKQEQTVEKIAKPSRKIPKNYKEAMDSDEKEEWSRAIGEELQNMERMDVFEVAPLDKMQHTINGGWIFAKKINNLSGKVCYKAHYVAQGNRQCYNKEYKETFAPMATFSAFQLLLMWYSIPFFSPGSSS
ncbi:hypothetical protein O181_084892 [Austropuccinia psidii MF-1]|uniref:Reverse transcriptase Ty1/copia-type domain-containing protein n=1 Tax=Austropuccinia psidii MF-1 TaxID=1389203 RepID=A0A9Q3FX27_9BASI|nr:hypothetical protein [Austropuccinia psidii MF-1]